MPGLILRDVADEDLLQIFGFESDPEAIHIAAFTSENPANHDAFLTHWTAILAAPGIITKSIIRGEELLGTILSYLEEGQPEVTYWIGRQHWGQGIATEALMLFLGNIDTRRPMRARSAKDNVASLRVLEKCGFQVIKESRDFANARGTEIDELELELPIGTS